MSSSDVIDLPIGEAGAARVVADQSVSLSEGTQAK